MKSSFLRLAKAFSARIGISRLRARRRQMNYLRELAAQSGCSFSLKRDSVCAVRRGQKEIRLSSKNYVYAQDLIKNFDYYFEVVRPRSESGLLVVDYSKPALHTMADDGLEFWFPELAESMKTTGIYLERANLRPGQTVFDLGAYAGGATYHFSLAVGPAGRVFAFEPDPRSFGCLERNLALHRLDNVSAHRTGVWSETGRVLFQAEGSMGSAIEEASDRSSDTKQWVDVVSLSDFCARNEIQRVDFLKMDVEGSEAPILEASADFMARYRPAMIIEVHRVKGVRSDSAVAGILRSRGYAVEVLEQAGLELPLLFARPV